MGNVRKSFADFMQDESGMGVVEIILIIVVLIALVIIFAMAIACLTYGNKIAKEMNDNE